MDKENPLRNELDVLRLMFFSKYSLGLNIFKLLTEFNKYKSPQYSLADLLKSKTPPTMFTPGEIYDNFSAYLVNVDKKYWKYVIKVFDNNWHVIDEKDVYFGETGDETHSALVNGVMDELSSNFPDWKYNPVPFNDIPVMIDYDDFMSAPVSIGENASSSQVKPLTPIKMDNVSENDEMTLEVLNDMISKVNTYIGSNTLTPKKITFFNSLKEEIYNYAKLGGKVKISQLEALNEKVNIFVAKKPLFVFHGYNFDNVFRPTNIDAEEFFIYDLTKTSDYKEEFANKIKFLSSVLDEYTIYLLIHGAKQGFLGLSETEKVNVSDFVDIANANRDGSVVNLIVGSCHGGTALNSNILKEGVNVLLVSGVNDVGFVTDTKYIKVNDLVSTYFNLVKDKRYGSFLYLNGQKFNSLFLAESKAISEGNAPLAWQLQLLQDLFFSKTNSFATNLFYLLLNFPQWQSPNLPYSQLSQYTSVPFIFNPLNGPYDYRLQLTPPVDLRKSWKYEAKAYDTWGKNIATQEILFDEADGKTHEFIVDKTEAILKKYFPNWEYEEVDMSSLTTEAIHTEEEVLSQKLSAIPTENISNQKRLDKIQTINKNILKVNELDINTLTPKKAAVYQEIKEMLAKVLKNPAKATSAQLNKIEKFTRLLTMQKPVLVLQGKDLNVFLPGHMDLDFRVLNLSKVKKYKEKIAKEIQDYAKVFDNFMVYIDMHGNVFGELMVSQAKDGQEYVSSVSEIADIIKENKLDSQVDLVSGACHSGAGYTEDLQNKGINILLLRGSNDVCYQTDKNFIQYGDLPATYLDALQVGRYGSYLIYEGQVYNPIKEALAEAKDNEALSSELSLLKKVYMEEDVTGTKLGRNLLKLLRTFKNYSSDSVFSEIVQNGNQIPFMFDAVMPFGYRASSHLSLKGSLWQYVFRVFNENNDLVFKKAVNFSEPNKETFDFILNSSQKALNNKEVAPIAPSAKEALSSEQPQEFFLIKTPNHVAKFLVKKGVNEQDAKEIASACFDGLDKEYNSLALDKALELLEKGVDSKYIGTMLVALSLNHHFSPELYNKALALHEKHNISLPASAYLTSVGISFASYDQAFYDNLDKLLENNFDFSKTKETYESIFSAEESNYQLLKDMEDVQIELLSSFANSGTEFDIDAWRNLIYIAKRTEGNFASLSYTLHQYLSMLDFLQPASSLLGPKLVSDAIEANYKRYMETFKDLAKALEPELFPLLKEQLDPLSPKEKLQIVSLLASSVNKRNRVLDIQGKKDLISKISDKKEFKKEINKIVFKQLDFEYTDDLGEKIDFSSNDYISQILQAQYHFYMNLNLLMSLMKENPGKTVTQILDALPENKAFAKVCEEKGIDYQAWRTFNPESSITREVLINGAQEPLQKAVVTVKKVDMDNIAKALTTGNESHSCRSVGRGQCGEASPNLIRNKMVQQLEIVVDGRAVGNALLYLAEVDGELSIIVGSFVKKAPYFSYEVTQLIMDYVKQIRQEITTSKLPIYYSRHLEIDNHFNYPVEKHQVKLLGEGFNPIFNSMTHDFIMPYTHKTYEVELYTVENDKGGGDKTSQITPEMVREKLLAKDVDEAYVKVIIENLSIDGKFSPELYEKMMELEEKYHDNFLKLSNLMPYTIQNGSFNPVAFNSIQEMYETRVHFNELLMMRDCTINGVFREDLFKFGLSLDKKYGYYASRAIKDFTDKDGVFNQEYWNAFDNLINQTKHEFDDFYECIQEFFYSVDDIKKAFDLLGIKIVTDAIVSNKDRYLNIFRELFESIDVVNISLLKTKLEPLSTEKKLEAITLLAGSVNKKDTRLKSTEISDLIDKIGNEKEFKDGINRIVFQQLDLEYSPEMAEIFNFASSKYLSLIMKGNFFFDAGLKSLFDVLKADTGKSVKEKLDALPENIAFAEICKQNNIDYEAWRGYDPNSFITRNAAVNGEKEPIIRETFTVRKVNMDDVLKALTSGNESACCRAVGNGQCKEAAPELIRNKMVQQVELLDRNNKVIGNVLVYLAQVNGELAMVMGSIVRKDSYYVSKEINEMIIDYVRQMRKDIGRPDIPIYMSSYLKIASNYPMEWKRVMLLGEGDSKIFNSFVHEFEVPSRNKVSPVLLYKVDDGEDETSLFKVIENSFSFKPAELLVKNFYRPNTSKEFFGIPVFKLDVFKNGSHSEGTGFYLKYRDFPFILTAAHVVKGNTLPYVSVYTDNGFNMKSNVLNISDKSDLAVLSVPKGKLDFVSPWTLALKEPEVGENMFSIGFPNSGERKVNEVSLLNKTEEVNDNIFYLHDKGTITFGASGSPLSRDKYSSELFGVISAIDEDLPLAISVPLPQIKTFMGETIKKIIFTPELNRKYVPLYPDFAKKYSNILEKYHFSLPTTSSDTQTTTATGTSNTNFQPAVKIIDYTGDVFKDIESNPTTWTEETAANYLKGHGFSQRDIQEVLKYANLNKEFDSAFFDLFVQGYKIKPDRDFSMVALYYSLKGNIFDYQIYSTIYAIAKKIPQMTFGEIQDFSLASPQELGALFYVADNFPDVNPFEIMNLASSSYAFKAENFNFDNYERIVSLLKEGVSFDAVKAVYNTCLTKDNTFDENIFKTIDKIADEAIKRKNIFLSAKNKQFTDIDVKDFIYQLATPIKDALEIVDEPTLIAAMGYKMVKFEGFIVAARKLESAFYGSNLKEQFLETFYPSKSQKAKDLQAEITALKQQFATTKGTSLVALKQKINTATRELRNLLEREKNFSPQEKIEMIEIMSPFRDDFQDLEELLETAKKIKTEGKEIWNNKIFDLMVSHLGAEYNMKVEETLHLLQSPYLRHFFVSMYKSVLFREQWEKFLPLLSKEDFSKTLDLLDNNVATKEEFKKYALDYARYTNPKFFPSRSFYDGNNLIQEFIFG